MQVSGGCVGIICIFQTDVLVGFSLLYGIVVFLVGSLILVGEMYDLTGSL